MPAYIPVKLSRTTAAVLQGLEANIIPIKSATTPYRINIQQRDEKKAQKPFVDVNTRVTATYRLRIYQLLSGPDIILFDC